MVAVAEQDLRRLFTCPRSTMSSRLPKLIALDLEYALPIILTVLKMLTQFC